MLLAKGETAVTIEEPDTAKLVVSPIEIVPLKPDPSLIAAETVPTCVPIELLAASCGRDGESDMATGTGEAVGPVDQWAWFPVQHRHVESAAIRKKSCPVA